VVGILARYLKSHGIRPALVKIAPGRPNLLATLRSSRPGRHLLLCGHTDTVAPNAGAAANPFSGAIHGGRLFGRGAADMKGALAAMAAAMATLKKLGALSAGSVTLAAVIDEEMASLGAEALIKSGFKADGAVVGEPTQNRVALGHKGLEWLEIEFKGKSTHGGTAASASWKKDWSLA
jgi:acetylornithine deacetylase/succinyl-diaminopimelate desuccinylase